MDFVKQQLGPETTLSVSVTAGVVTLRFEHDGASGSEVVEIKESLKYFIDKEKDKLPSWAQGLITIGEASIP